MLKTDSSGPWRRLAPWLIVLLLIGCGTVPDPPPVMVERRMPPSQSQPDLGMQSTPDQRIADWQALIANMRGASTPYKLAAVNEFFNRLNFVDDISHWGRDDYWATPLETLITNGGDCEDFTIAKYFTLRLVDIPDERMRLIYVKSLGLNQPHMVLGYYHQPEAEPVLLDNLVTAILPASRRRDLIPVYSFNGAGLWVAKQRAGSSDRLEAWRELMRIMEFGGLNLDQ